MKALSKVTELPSFLPESVWRVFHSLPLPPGPGLEDYQRLLFEILHDLRPADVIEALWCKDVVDSVFDAQLLRSVRAQLLGPDDHADLSHPNSVGELLTLTGNPGGEQHWPERNEEPSGRPRRNAGIPARSRSQRNGQRTSRQEWNDFAASGATAHEMHGLELERISRMIAQADARRDAALHQMERRRARSNAAPAPRLASI